MPQHVAIIMDGNGRWAESRGLERSEGHRAGVEAIRDILAFCPQKKIPMLSLFAFGQENWSRPAEEVNFLMCLFMESLEREFEALHEKGVRVRFVGERTLLDASLQSMMQSVESLTKDNTALKVNMFMSYSGRWDILNAARRVSERVQAGALLPADINEAAFSDALATQGLPEPDLFIRTSGEQRISNFLLWQLAYTELYFTDILWPDFTQQAFEAALNWFASRERRYGKTSKQLIGEDNA